MTPDTKTRAIKELEVDEGVRDKVYLDHLNFMTAGMGHLLAVGDHIVPEQVTHWATVDVDNALSDCRYVYPGWDDFEPELQLIVMNMMFNLGRTRYRKFHRHIHAVKRGDYHAAAEEMVDSRWYEQVPNRASRLTMRMRALAGEGDGEE